MGKRTFLFSLQKNKTKLWVLTKGETRLYCTYNSALPCTRGQDIIWSVSTQSHWWLNWLWKKINHVNLNSEQGQHLSGGLEGFCLLTLSPSTIVPQQRPLTALFGNGDLTEKKIHNKLLSVITNTVLYFFTAFTRRVKQPLRQWHGFCANLGFFRFVFRVPKRGKCSALDNNIRGMHSFLAFLSSIY